MRLLDTVNAMQGMTAKAVNKVTEELDSINGAINDVSAQIENMNATFDSVSHQLIGMDGTLDSICSELNEMNQVGGMEWGTLIISFTVACATVAAVWVNVWHSKRENRRYVLTMKLERIKPIFLEVVPKGDFLVSIANSVTINQIYEMIKESDMGVDKIERKHYDDICEYQEEFRKAYREFYELIIKYNAPNMVLSDDIDNHNNPQQVPYYINEICNEIFNHTNLIKSLVDDILKCDNADKKVEYAHKLILKVNKYKSYIELLEKFQYELIQTIGNQMYECMGGLEEFNSPNIFKEKIKNIGEKLKNIGKKLTRKKRSRK